ncbi:MAG TPA: hypothetical protein EYP63_06325, partial [Desulfotomaculum sp.]|nr:hypothetical protein [Desulfotomaculum sp.]
MSLLVRFKLAATGLFLMLIFYLLPVYPAAGYQVVVFDAHMHSKYSDEGKMTKDRDVNEMADDVQGKLGVDENAKKCAFAVTDHSDVVAEYFPWFMGLRVTHRGSGAAAGRRRLLP